MGKQDTPAAAPGGLAHATSVQGARKANTWICLCCQQRGFTIHNDNWNGNFRNDECKKCNHWKGTIPSAPKPKVPKAKAASRPNRSGNPRKVKTDGMMTITT